MKKQVFSCEYCQWKRVFKRIRKSKHSEVWECTVCKTRVKVQTG